MNSGSGMSGANSYNSGTVSLRESRVNTGDQVRNESPLRKGYPIDESAILIKIGLSNYNTPSVEHLTGQTTNGENRKLFEHSIREGAP